MNGLVRFSARAIAAACTLLLIGSTALRAQTAPSTSNHSTTTQSASTLSPSIVGHSGLEFLENKGQVVDDQGRKVESVRFTAHSQGAKLFLMPDRIAHVFIEASGPGAKHEPGKGISSKELDQTRIRYQRVDMELVGASSKVNLRGDGVLPGVTNFFTASAGPEGITGVRSFSTVVYENVYPNIDLVLKARGKGMKAEYIVRPGGDPRSIRLRITGAQGLERTPEGGYRIRTVLGTITEDAPYSFVRTADGSEQEVAVRFRIEGDEIAFDVPAYDHSQTLVIDPGRDWGTFHGGTAEDVGTGIAVQRSFNPSNTTPYIYICGYTAGGTFPIVSASQGTYGGGAYDAFVAAYQYGGARQYSTYYGGSNDDRAWGITADGSGNVWVVGQTRSAAWTGSAFTNTPAGDIDAFVAYFDNTGVPQAARFVGGANDDYFLAVAYDGTNLTCGGYTASPGLATTGVFQTTYNGLYCGMIARLPATSLNAITWLTYYGNNTGSLNGQETYVTSLSPRGTSGEVWVGGYTNSPNTSNAIATTGSFKTFPNGFLPNFVNYDGFVALMTSSGGRTASTYYGEDEDDRVLGVAADPLDATAVIAVGRTNSPNVGSFIASATGFNTVLNNGTNLTSSDDGFVTRLTVSGTTLQRDWGSYWGSTQDDYLTSVAVDDNNVNEAGSNTISAGRGGKIFVAGLTAGSSGDFSGYNFDGGYNTNQGGYDAVWSRIFRAPSGSPVVEYSVITGGSGNDIANGIAVDNQRNVHIVGTATTPGGGNLAGGSGAAQTTYGGGASDAFAVKWCDLIVPNAPQFSTTGEGGTFTSTVSVCQNFNSSATGFVTTPGPYPNVEPGTTYGSCPPSAVQTLTVRLTNAVEGVQYRLEDVTTPGFIDITPGTGTSAVTANTVLATQDGTVYVSISAANLPAPGTYDLRWVAYTQTVGSSCQENGVTQTGALTVNSLPANDAISQQAPGTDNNSAAAPGSTFNFYACGGSANQFTVATAGLTYNWCVMQNGSVTTAPTVSGANTQTVTITPNTGAGQRDTLYLRVRLTNGSGCAIEYQAALYVLPVVDIQSGIANETTDPDANPQHLCVDGSGAVIAPATYSYQDSGPHSLVNTYGNATIPGNGATGSDAVTAVTQAYAWSATPAGEITGVIFSNPSSPNGGTISVTIGTFSSMLNPQPVTFNLQESYTGGGINTCSRTATYTVNFYPQPTVAVAPSPAGPICEGTNVTFTITVTPSTITSGSFTVTLNAATQTGAQIISGTNVSGGTFGGTTYSGTFTANPFTLTVNPGTVTAAYDAQGSISLTVNTLTNGASPVSCPLTAAVTSAPVQITQNPDPITSFQQAPANTANTPTYGIGNPLGNLVPPTTSQTGTTFEACLYDATNGFGQEYTYTIVLPPPSSPPNDNDNYTWTIPGTLGVDYTLVSGGGTQLGNVPPFATIQWLTPGSRTITITQVNNQAPGTCQTVNTFDVNVNNLPSSPGSINWLQANWCENSTVSFTYTVPALSTAAFPIQVQFYGEYVDPSSPGTYAPAPMVAITNVFPPGVAGSTVGPFSFTAGNIIGGTPPTWVDISIAVSIVDANGCGRWGPAGVGDPFRSVSTRIWDTPAEPQVQDWAAVPNLGPFGDNNPAGDIVCPNKQTNPNALVPATGMIYPDDNSLGNPIDGWYNYQIANLSDYPAGTTFNWQILDNSLTVLTPGIDYDIQFSSTGGYNNNRVQIRWGKHLNAVSPLTFDISVTFPSSSGGCTLPFGAPFDPTAAVTISPVPNPNIVGDDPNDNGNGTASLSLPPGLCSGQTAMYDCGVVGAASYQWNIVLTGANGNSPAWSTAPTFSGANSQIFTVNWPAFSDVPIRWPRIDVRVQDLITLCYEGDTATAYILAVPDATPIMVGPEGPCVFNSENSHIKAFTVPKSTSYTIASVTWSLTNGLGAVYSYSTTGAPFTAPNANDTVRYQFYSAGNETITVTVTATNGCSVTGSLNFTIFPPPNPVISGPASVCYGQTGVPYAATPYISFDTYQWEIIPSNGGTIIPGSTPDQITINWTGSGGANTYQIRLTQISAQGCTARVYYTVVVNPLPTPLVSGPSTICANQNYTYTTQNNAPASSYVWSILNNTAGASIVSGQNTATVTVSATTAGGSFDLQVTETIIATTCSASNTMTGIQVVASPTPSISRQSPPGPVGQACVGQTITYLTPASGNAYQWSVTGGGSIVSASTNNTVQIAWSATGSQTITLTETIGNCSVTVTQTVNVVPQPTPVVSGPSVACSGSGYSYTYSTANNAGSTYSWNLGSGVSAIGPTTNASVTVTFSNSTLNSVNRTLFVTETNSANCSATSATLNVAVTSTPQPSITGTTPVCQNTSATYSDANAASQPPATTYNWSVTGGTITGAATNASVTVLWTGTGSQTVTLVATNNTNSANCQATATYNVVVNPAPTAYNVGTTTPTACSNVSNNVTITLSGSQTGVTYTVNRSPGGAQGTLAGTGSALSFTQTVSTAGTYQYTITASDGTCSGTMNGTATVVVTDPPTASISGGPTDVCSGTTATYAASPTSGVTYAWSVSGSGNIVQSTTANQATILFGMTSGTATVSVTVTDGNGCTGSASQNVTVHALPSDLPVSISPSAICAAGGVSGNVTSSTITVGDASNPVQANTTYQLMLGSTVVASTTTGASPPDDITFTVGSLSAGTYGYSVRAISSTTPACTTVMTQTATLVVNPLPTPAVTGPTSPCQNTAVTYVTTNNTGSTYSWTTSGASFTASGPTNTYQLNGTWTGTGSGTVTVTETNSNGCGQTNSLSVNVQPAPTPTITASQPNPICGGQTVTFTATPSGATSYTWTVGSNGTLQSGQGTSSIVVTWANVPSSYSSSVSVVVNVGGCTGSANYTVNVNPQATPTISGPATICSGQSGTYSTPLTTGRTYSWSTTSTPPGMTPFSQSGVNLNSVLIDWVNTSSSPFVATVQVVESAGGVCTGTATYNVTVNPLPSTAITGPTSVCQGQTVTYSHTPALTGHSFAWTVTNAQSWSGQGTGAITVTWGNTNGTVALTVTNNSTGCTNTATNSPLVVTVNPNPTPTISGNVNPCAGSTQTYSTQTGMTSYNWSITPASAGTIIGQNDQSSVTIQWSNTQVTATLTVQVNNSGCTGQQSITINVQPNPTPAISGVAQTCPGVDRTYTTPYTAGNTYSWTISYTPGFIITGGSTTSNTVTVRFNSPGASSQTATLQVTETSPYGCQGTATQTVTVQPAPQPVISGNTNVCGYLAQYDGIPINNTETYVVSDANGIDYSTANIVWTLPFGGGTFTGASSGTGVTTVTVQWDEPTAAATVGRQIAAQVTLGAPTNCTGQTTSNVQVNWNPKPSISGPRAWCDNSLYTANSTSASQSGLATYSVQVPVTPVLPSGSSRTYNWTITPASAGTVVSGQGTPTVQVSWTSGLANTPLNAVLSVTETINYLNTSATPTNQFCGVTDTFRVVINPIPKPVITSPNNGITGPNGLGPCGRDTYTYQVAADANSSYQWVVSGGSIIGASTGNSINVQWNNVTSPTPGYVGVTQTFLTPATMCSTYVQQNLTIQVKPSPKVIGPTVLCQQTNNGTNVGNYTVQTVVAGNTYQWFAEPASLVISTVVSGPQNQNFQVTWGGTSSTPLTAHVIVLETNPVTGCSERDTLTITLNPNPTPVITSTTGGLNPNGVCEGSTHIYQTQFNTGNSYLWTVTGGTISGAATNNQVTVVWGSAGTGTITVREQVGAMFGSGCWTQVTATVTIRPLPNPVITGPTTVCRYTEQSYAVQTPNVNNTYQWTVTNGSIQGSSTDPTVTVLWYDVPTGTIAVTETTPPSQGSCSNTASVNVTINPKPAPVISGPPAPPVCVNSTQTYSTPLVTGDTYQWTVTGGTIGGAATNNTVTVTWTTVGNGTISVKQANTLGCDTTVSRTIPVNALPSVTITPSGPTTICNGQSVTLLATPGFVSYSWNTGETTPNIVVTQSGTYVVTVVDNNGCSNNSNSITVTVQNVPAPQIQASGPTTFCQGQSVTLSITGTNIQGYAWSNGATTSSITVTTSGSYWCEVTYNNGCRARTEIIEVTVVPRPTVSITANGPTSFCEGGSVVLSAGAGFATYAWSNGTQTVGTSSTLTVTQAGTYTVTVTNNIGCSGTSQPVVVTVYPKPTPQIQASGPTEFCEGGSVTLDAGAGFASYQWSNGATTRTITVTQQGSYTVTVTDQNNCSGTSQPVVVTVYPKPPKPTITQTGGTLTSSSAAQYQWYYNGQPISGATDRSYTLVRGRDQSGYYKVSIRDNNGCENTSDEIYIDITPVEVAGDNTGIQFMPNPTSGELRIVFGDAIDAEHARVIVRNLVGRELLSVELGAISAGSSKTIDLANLPNGVYMVEVILPSGIRTIGRVTKVD